MFGMMVDIGPTFYGVPSPPPYRSSEFRIFLSKFYIKVFRTSLFPNPSMDLMHVWYDDEHWSKILQGTIPTPVHDPIYKVTDLQFLCKSFKSKVF